MSQRYRLIAAIAVTTFATVQVSGQAVLFRETVENAVPYGWDHCGFEVGASFAGEATVWEAHPGYSYPPRQQFFPPGFGWDPDLSLYILVPTVSGVFKHHAEGSFRWNSASQSSTPTTVYTRLSIDAGLAASMDAAALAYRGQSWDISYWSLLPAAQKGYIGPGFTCVGLVERCAEDVGYKNGNGFIPDYMEAFIVSNPIGTGDPFTVTGLTPAVLYEAIRSDWTSDSVFLDRVLRGYFDPVDFVITDSQGRRTGHTESLGTLDEIPGVYYSGDAEFETLVIGDAAPGSYSIELFGLDDDAKVALAVGGNIVFGFSGYLSQGEMVSGTFQIRGDCVADLDGNGTLNFDDIDAFVVAFLGGDLLVDLDGNGTLNFDDIDAFVNGFIAGCS